MKDDWIRAALTDDTVVVDVLLHLRKSSSSEPSSKRPCSIPLPPQKWGFHQTRSKPVTVMKKESATTTTTTNTRFSPTTPLASWSGGATSPSDGGYDESSRLPSDPSYSVRSKPFSELKEDDNLVLKEKLQLRKELASTRMTFHEQSTWNPNVKRMKLDLNLQSTNVLGATFEVSKHYNQIEVSSRTEHHRVSPCFELGSSHSCKLEEKETPNGGFVLPDLNMMPLEEETTGSESFYY